MSDADEKAPSSGWAEAERRTARYREGLERIRREHGLWVGGEDGKPRWLPPGSLSGPEGGADTRAQVLVDDDAEAPSRELARGEG